MRHRHQPVLAPLSITNKNTEVVEIHIRKFQLEQLLFPQTCEYKCRERRVIPNAQELICVRIVGNDLKNPQRVLLGELLRNLIGDLWQFDALCRIRRQMS